MLGQFPVERLSIEAKHSRGSGLIARGGTHRTNDVFARDVGQESAFGRARVR
jgi:hypothetical protein